MMWQANIAGTGSESRPASSAVSTPEGMNMNSESLQIEHEETALHGEFRIGRHAIMTYHKDGNKHIVVNHTRVAQEARGQGLAGKLYRAMVDYARAHDLKVTPACSYVIRMLERFPDDRDILQS
jgi:predicted GNAT family acetyltransferase